MTLTAERLRDLIKYDSETGVFTWVPRAGRNGSWCNLDREAGSVCKATGYRSIRVDKKLYQAHRLAWLYVNGAWPDSDIDHRNGKRLDNRIGNLRDVPNVVNRENMRTARVDNETGVLGVTVDRRRGGFNAKIRVRGRSHFLGHFASVDMAHVAYLTAKRALHAGVTI